MLAGSSQAAGAPPAAPRARAECSCSGKGCPIPGLQGLGVWGSLVPMSWGNAVPAVLVRFWDGCS